MDTERKTPVSDLEIGRRLADYSPVDLYYMGLFSQAELERISFTDHYTNNWNGYRKIVAIS